MDTGYSYFEVPEATPVVGSVSDYICRVLELLNVGTVFGVNDAGVEPFIGALRFSEQNSGLRPIFCSHESGAVFMADGYARVAGKLGVCFAMSGSQATNMIPGVATAYQDHVPLLVIMIQPKPSKDGNHIWHLQDNHAVNVNAMFQHCTHYSAMITDISQVEYKLEAALQAALSGALCGPAFISISAELLGDSFDCLPKETTRILVDKARLVDEDLTANFTRRVASAWRPVFVVGGDADDAINEIFCAADLLGAKVVSTAGAKGFINIYHPAYYGVLGACGHRSAVEMLSIEADLIVAVGIRKGEEGDEGWDRVMDLSGDLIYVDENFSCFHQSASALLQVWGSISGVFFQLLKFLRERDDYESSLDSPWEAVLGECNDKTSYMARSFIVSDEDKCFSDDEPIKPQRLMFELSCRCLASTRFIAEGGDAYLWALHYLQPRKLGLTPGWGVLGGELLLKESVYANGWSAGAAVGMALGSGGEPVVVLVDGANFLMAGCELRLANELAVPVVYVVINDSTKCYSDSPVQAGSRQLPRTDFSSVANAMGVESYKIRTPSDLTALDFGVLARKKRPVLLDVLVDEGERPPQLECFI